MLYKKLEKFDQKREKKYGYANKYWKNNIKELISFFEFPFALRMMIYKTNFIENAIEILEKL